MDRSTDLAVDFTLAPAALRFAVEVRLRRSGQRWVAVVQIDGRAQTGIGTTARAALTAALDSLGQLAVTVLMADPALLEPSVAIAEMATG